MHGYNQEMIVLYCPYCGEKITSIIDLSVAEQQYYEDCSVCCAPILFTLEESMSGKFTVSVKRDDE